MRTYLALSDALLRSLLFALLCVPARSPAILRVLLHAVLCRCAILHALLWSGAAFLRASLWYRVLLRALLRFCVPVKLSCVVLGFPGSSTLCSALLGSLSLSWCLCGRGLSVVLTALRCGIVRSCGLSCGSALRWRSPGLLGSCLLSWALLAFLLVYVGGRSLGTGPGTDESKSFG